MIVVSKQSKLKNRAFQGKIYHCLRKADGCAQAGGEEKIEFAYFPDGLLVLDETGKIQACGHRPDVAKQVDLASCRIEIVPDGQVILPGLIDLHVHLPQFNVTARQEDNLLQWLDRHIFPEEMRFSETGYARQISELFFKALLKNGTTTACVFLTSHTDATRIAFESADKLGNRVVMGLNLMDCQAPKPLIPDADTLLRDTEELYKTWHNKGNGRLLYAWMPRFALSCSNTLLSGIGDLRRKYPDAYLHTHISEQLDEIEAVKRMFPWSKDYTDVYGHYGLLGPQTILAHGVHLQDIELDYIAEQSCGLAHCPSSNFFLKSGRFPWRRIAEKNVRFGFGSDVGAGPELSIFRALRDAQFMQGDSLLSVHQLFYRATLGAAQVLHLDSAIGNLEPGKQADFIIVDFGAKQAVPDVSLPIDLLLAGLVYTGDDRVVVKTFVSGQEVYSAG